MPGFVLIIACATKFNKLINRDCYLPAAPSKRGAAKSCLYLDQALSPFAVHEMGSDMKIISGLTKASMVISDHFAADLLIVYV